MNHEIPVNSKSETRLFVIFSLRALATTAVGAIVGAFLGFVLSFWGPTVFPISLGVCAFIGFLIGTFKIIEIKKIPITRDVAGMYLYEVVYEYFKFKGRRKLYIYPRVLAKEKKEEIEEE